MTRISTGTEGTGNSDACDPVANSAHEHWNVLGSEENCGVVAIGGSGGVARTDGTVYFLSPEKLDGSGNGTQNAPNLYVARPGDGYAPHYVTTLESALDGPQPPPTHHLLVRSFGSFSHAAFVAVDPSDGDVYVADTATHTVSKFDSSGSPIASWGVSGVLSGDPSEGFGEIAGIAVGPSGVLYVLGGPEGENNHLFKFEQEGGFIEEFETAFGDKSVGIAVDSEGNIYKARASGVLAKLAPSGASLSGNFAPGVVTGIAVDPSTDDVYAAYGAKISRYESSGASLGALTAPDLNGVVGVAVDQTTHDVYADEGNRVVQFEASGSEVGASGAEVLSGSTGLAAYGDRLDVSNAGAGKVAIFGPLALIPSPLIDSPAVVDSVSSPEATDTADFQVTPNGEYAAFPSTLALAGGEEETAGHQEVYRYDTATSKLDCVSCSSTGAPSAGDSSLASNGLSLLGDGRVFFNSTDQLVSADTDGKQDVYELSEPGVGNCDKESTAFDKATGDCLALISAGTSPFDSGLLTASSNGKDAYFFTRDSLAPQDKNGATMKIYDAREGGGFPYVEPEQQCQASDECHGAGSAGPGPVEVGSVAGTPGNATEEKEVKCKKGTVKRHGACVKLHKHKKHHKRTNHKRGGHK